MARVVDPSHPSRGVVNKNPESIINAGPESQASI
jgi:hypothetical protein